MKRKIFSLSVFFQFLFASVLTAQNEVNNPFVCIDVTQDSAFNSTQISKSAYKGENASQKVQNVLNTFLKRQNDNFSLDNEKILYDDNNNPHYRYDVKYKGIPVYNYQYTVHTASDTLNTITGLSLFKEDISIISSITANEALEVAKHLFPSKQYYCEIEGINKDTSENVITHNIPTPELVIYKTAQQSPILSYRVELYSITPFFSYEVFISASDGSLVHKNNLMYNVTPATGSAELDIHGEKTINTSFDETKYILFDQVHNIKTYNVHASDTIQNATIYEDDDNNWTMSEFPESNLYSENAGLVCHWAAGITHDFFFNTFGRNGYDGNGTLLKIYANYGGIGLGIMTYWNGISAIIVGSGSDFWKENHYGVLDVITHEFGHGVTLSSVNLHSSGESASVNESLSDIWAACVENYLGGRTQEQIWQMGEDRGKISRSMSNPKTYNHPDTYHGNYWDPNIDTDTINTHINAGVMNHWFYLLVNGGNGVNDNNHEYSVNGIGFDKSMKIVYNTLTLYLTPYSNFQDVRDKSLLVARNLYGNDSEEYISVMNAWHAVGVGNPYIPTTINGEFGVCDGGTYFVENLPPMATISWSTDTYVDGLPNNPITKQKLSIINGQNTSDIVVERTALFMQEIGAETRRYVGDVTLCATITCNGVTSKIYKNLFANNKLELSCTNNLSNGIYPQHLYSYTFKANTLPDYLVWDIEEPGKAKRKVYGEQEVILAGTTPGIIRVTVVDGGGCADYNSQTRTIINRSIEIAHKNPASYGENIQINTYICNDENNTFSTYSNSSKTPYPEEFVIELWSEEFGMVKKIESDSYTLELPLNGVIPGNYILRMTSKDGIILSTSQLIINQF